MAVDVDDGNGDDGALHEPRIEALQHPPDDLDPTDFVAVDRGAQPDRGAVGSAVDDLDGQRGCAARDQIGDRQLDLTASTRLDGDAANPERGSGRRRHRPTIRGGPDQTRVANRPPTRKPTANGPFKRYPNKPVPNSRVTQTGKNVGVPDEFVGIRQKSQELDRWHHVA